MLGKRVSHGSSPSDARPGRLTALPRSGKKSARSADAWLTARSSVTPRAAARVADLGKMPKTTTANAASSPTATAALSDALPRASIILQDFDPRCVHIIQQHFLDEAERNRRHQDQPPRRGDRDNHIIDILMGQEAVFGRNADGKRRLQNGDTWPKTGKRGDAGQTRHQDTQGRRRHAVATHRVDNLLRLVQWPTGSLSRSDQRQQSNQSQRVERKTQARRRDAAGRLRAEPRRRRGAGPLGTTGGKRGQDQAALKNDHESQQSAEAGLRYGKEAANQNRQESDGREECLHGPLEPGRPVDQNADHQQQRGSPREQRRQSEAPGLRAIEDFGSRELKGGRQEMDPQPGQKEDAADLPRDGRRDRQCPDVSGHRGVRKRGPQILEVGRAGQECDQGRARDEHPQSEDVQCQGSHGRGPAFGAFRSTKSRTVAGREASSIAITARTMSLAIAANRTPLRESNRIANRRQARGLPSLGRSPPPTSRAPAPATWRSERAVFDQELPGCGRARFGDRLWADDCLISGQFSGQAVSCPKLSETEHPPGQHQGGATEHAGQNVRFPARPASRVTSPIAAKIPAGKAATASATSCPVVKERKSRCATRR